MKNKFVALDFEFRDTKTKDYHVICACLYNDEISKKFWLENNPRNIEIFKKYMYDLANQGYIFIAHFATAEVWSMLSLEFNIDPFHFLDTFVEFKLLQNDDNKSKRKLLSLADICLKYNIFDYYRNDYKDKMRDLCLTDKEYTTQDKENILEYCLTDVKSGFEVARQAMREYKRIFGSTYNLENAIKRAEVVKGFCLASYNMGLPLDTEFVDKVRANYQRVFNNFIETSHEDVQYCYEKSGNGYIFKGAKLEEVIAKHGLGKTWGKTASGKYTTSKDDLKKMRHYSPFIESLYSTLKNTKSLSYHKPNTTKDLAKELKLNYSKSQDLEAEVFKLALENKTITTVKDNLKIDKCYINSAIGKEFTKIGDIYNYVCDNNPNIKQSIDVYEAYKIVKKELLNKVEEDSNDIEEENTFYNSIKGDTIHMYYNPYGTISARNAPRAKSFLFAQPAWARTMIKVPKDYKMVSLDFSSAEIFLGALVTDDSNLLESYHSKDFYLKSGVLMGVIPIEDFEALSASDLKTKYKDVRNMLKILILSKQYGAGAASIAKSLYPTESEGIALNKTRKLVAKYERAYTQFFRDTTIFKKKFTNNTCLMWHWGFNNPERQLTVGNWRIQTSNAIALHECVTKLSTQKMIDKGLSFVTSLHDAIMVAIKDDDRFDARLDYVIKTMKDACDTVTGNTGKQIRVEYQTFESESNFIEKDREGALKIAELVGHKLDFRDSDPIEV